MAHVSSPVSWRSLVPMAGFSVKFPVNARDGALRSYLQAEKGARYEVRVRNVTGERLGLVIAVDGRNIINGKKSDLARTEPMYVLDAWSLRTTPAGAPPSTRSMSSISPTGTTPTRRPSATVRRAASSRWRSTASCHHRPRTSRTRNPSCRVMRSPRLRHRRPRPRIARSRDPPRAAPRRIRGDRLWRAARRSRRARGVRGAGAGRAAISSNTNGAIPCAANM